MKHSIEEIEAGNDLFLQASGEDMRPPSYDFGYVSIRKTFGLEKFNFGVQNFVRIR